MTVRSLFFLLAAFVVSLAVTMPEAHAYLTPSQVFGTENSTVVQEPVTTHAAASSQASGVDRTDPAYLPPNQRAAENEAALQQSQRDFQYADIEDIEVHPAAPAEDTSPERNLLDDETQYELRRARMEESKQNGGNVTIVVGGDGSQVVSADGTVLRSAAPRVTATGPETMLMGLILVLAAASTVLYARYREQNA